MAARLFRAWGWIWLTVNQYDLFFSAKQERKVVENRDLDTNMFQHSICVETLSFPWNLSYYRHFSCTLKIVWQIRVSPPFLHSRLRSGPIAGKHQSPTVFPKSKCFVFFSLNPAWGPFSATEPGMENLFGATRVQEGKMQAQCVGEWQAVTIRASHTHWPGWAPTLKGRQTWALFVYQSMPTPSIYTMHILAMPVTCTTRPRTHTHTHYIISTYMPHTHSTHIPNYRYHPHYINTHICTLHQTVH